MGTQDIVRALEGLRRQLPWLDRVEVEFRDDSAGEPAIFVRLVVCSGVEDLFEDGARLMDARRQVRAVLDETGIELWPFIGFVSADEVEAA